MPKPNIFTLIGTRPEIIKMSPLLPLLDNCFCHTLIHSGQHYSFSMNGNFFEELSLREPDVCLEVGSHSPGTQTALILLKFEKLLLKGIPDAIIVQGDTNTALAGALASAKHREKGVKLIHVEAGTRSHNKWQPEELNRKIVDQLSDLLLVPHEKDLENLEQEGITDSKIVVTGNTVIESCMRISKLIDGTDICRDYGIERGKYTVSTFHRQENVDDAKKLQSICKAIKEISNEYSVIVPLHPRTKKMLGEFGITLSGKKLKVIAPVGYRDMIALLKNSRFCLTDSGGIVEESAILKIPGLILREETEHRQYIEIGMHRLVSTVAENIVKESKILIEDDEEYASRKKCTVAIKSFISRTILGEIVDFLDECPSKKNEHAV